MEPITRQIHLPGLFIIAIISLEISGYFLYLYFKKKKERLFLNKLLLAYGVLTGIGLTSLVIRLINNYYNEDLKGKVLINAWIHIVISGTTLIYIIILSTKDFNQIIRNKYPRFIILFSFITSIYIAIYNSTEWGIIIVLITVLVIVGFMAIFQIKLITSSTGIIKKRLEFITSGGAIALITLILSSNDNNIYFPEQNELLLIWSIPLMMGGLLLILFAILDFPVFLEFNWKKQLVNLYILEKKQHNQLFKYDFTKHQQTFNPEYLPGGLLGIEKIISAVTDTPEKKIHRIEQKGLIFIMIRSESVIYTLVVKKEMRSIHFFLESVMERFENLYKRIIKDLNLIRGREEIYFVGFDTELNEILEQ